MTERIDRFRRFGAGADPPLDGTKVNIRQDPTVQGLLSTPSGTIDEAAIVRAERIYDKPLAVSLAERIVEKQRSALQAIRATREEQVRILDEAEDLALSARSNTLGQQRSTQETEVTRIRDATTVNGTSLFNDVAFDLSVTDISRGISAQAILPTSSGAVAAISSRGSTPSGAGETKTTTEQAIAALAAFSAGVTGLSAKVGGIIEKEDPNVIADKAAAAEGATESIDPTALASAIASQLSDPFVSERTRQAIIDTSAAKLDPQRVKRLLEEDDEETSS